MTTRTQNILSLGHTKQHIKIVKINEINRYQLSCLKFIGIHVRTTKKKSFTIVRALKVKCSLYMQTHAANTSFE